MGIPYQIKKDTIERVPAPQNFEVLTRTRRKTPCRWLEIDERNIEPYRKKPRMGVFSYVDSDFRNVPNVSERASKLDTLWEVAHAIKMTNIPMWSGFNSQIYDDPIPKQIVLYMPNINQSPTSNAVVVETLKMTKKCAEECGQQYGIVTYDLDVAKNAVKIQITEKPTYDDIFILFGAFHLEMCLFRAIGKTIDSSGIPEMLTDAGVLAPGSMRSFIECRNFNRCKRLHPVLALAFEILHFQKFFATYEHNEELKSAIEASPMNDSSSVDGILLQQMFDNMCQEYKEFTVRTLDGELGKTAKYCMDYVQHINIFHLLDRAVRESDIDMYCTYMA